MDEPKDYGFAKKIANWSRGFLANPLWRLLDLEDCLHVRLARRKQAR